MDLRSVIARAAPGLMADRARRYERGVRLTSGRTGLARSLVTLQGPVVAAGPFAGLSYATVDLADVDAASAKLAGVYEHDLAEVFAPGRFRTFIDVGAADGYYAVGFATANPEATVHAYDLSRSARRVCRQVAHTNGVAERVLIRRRFDRATARRLRLGEALVLVDIEGAEDELLDPALLEVLRRCTVVVEIHEHLVPGVSERLLRTLSASHHVTRVDESVSVVPEALAGWPEERARLAIDEMRGRPMHWFVCEPTSRSAAT